MRISDWSSDVCSSDLRHRCAGSCTQRVGCDAGGAAAVAQIVHIDQATASRLAGGGDELQRMGLRQRAGERVGETFHLRPRAARIQRKHHVQALAAGDRKSVVEGKSVSVRVDRGGRRISEKKKKKINKKDEIKKK